MHSYNWKKLPITEKIIKQVDRLAGDEGWKIMGDGYPLFEWYTGIEINETMANYKEENIMVGEEIPIKHEDNLENMEIWEGYEANDDVNKGKIIEDNEVGMRYTYITEENESNEYEGKD